MQLQQFLEFRQTYTKKNLYVFVYFGTNVKFLK